MHLKINKMKNKTVIRRGQENDLPEIYNLVKQLATYENEPDAVTATLEDYYNDYDAGLFKTIVATENDTTVGMMLYYTTYSTWKGKMIYLEDFIIKEKQRQRGIGQQMFNFLIQIAKEEKAKLIKWQVLDWNTPAVKFYKKNKALIENNWWNCKIFT